MNNISINDFMSKILKNNILLANIIGFFGLLLVGWVLYGNILLEESDDILLLGTILCIVVISFPALTAWALFQEDQKILQKIMRGVNFLLIIFWIAGAIYVVRMNLPKNLIFFGVIFIALPGWVNIKALSKLINSDKNLKPRRRVRHNSI